MRRIFEWMALMGLLLLGFYLWSQKPQVSCDSRWVSVALNKGGYRSWSLTFKPMIMLPGDPPPRPFSLPRFSHVDLRGKSESVDHFLTNGPMRWGALP